MGIYVLMRQIVTNNQLLIVTEGTLSVNYFNMHARQTDKKWKNM